MSNFKKKIRFNSLFYNLYLYANLFLKEKIFLKRKSYSQFEEDLFIKNSFKDLQKGIYVDIGCYHPVKFSNTALLHNFGWKGYNIDINRASIDLFKIARPSDINLNYSLSDKAGDKVVFYAEHLFSAINSLSVKNIKDFGVQNPIKLLVDTEIFHNLVKKKFNFLNIDCEGHDFEILKLIDLKFYEPDLICIEISKKNENNINNYMKNYHYSFIEKKGLSHFFKKN